MLHTGEEKRNIDGEWMTLEECYLKHHRLIWTGIRKVTGRRSIAEDVLDDLLSEGTLALIVAYRRYDVSKGYKFSTYLVSTVWGYIMRYFRDDFKIVKTGRSNEKLRNKIGKDIYDLTTQEIVNKYGVSREDVDNLKIHNLGVYSLDYEFEYDGNTATLKDTLVGEATDSTIYMVNEFINSLGERHKEILIQTLEGYSQVEVGKRIGQSQAQVSRDLKRIGILYREMERRELTGN